ncbi:MAG: ABC-2 type transport system permease protein [Bradymonadia bacterium]
MKALAIARREIVGYFNLPIAYMVVAAFLLLSGVYVFVLQPFFVNNRATLQPFFEFAPFLFTLFVPALTMRSLAEERRTGTLDVLLSWPVGDLDVVVGKFLGALGLLAIALLLTLAYPLTIASLGALDWGPIIGGYLGLLLLGGAYLALGLLVSALTQNQIVAFMGGFFVCFCAYIIGRAAPVVPDVLVPIVQGLSFERHFGQVARGVIDTRDLAFFGAVIVLGLGWTAEVLRSRRWR